VYKYPYCGTLDDTEDYLSNKICCYTIKTRKKFIKKAIIAQAINQYVSLGEKSEHKRFDPNFQQALAWKRLEAGTHNQDDIT
jgi:hypothetical protein